MNNKKKITLIALTAINLILIFIPMFVSVKPLPPDVPTVYVYTSLFNLSFNSFFWLFNSQNFNIYYLLIVILFLIIYISFALSLLFSIFLFKKEKLILGITITSVIEIAAWLVCFYDKSIKKSSWTYSVNFDNNSPCFEHSIYEQKI